MHVILVLVVILMSTPLYAQSRSTNSAQQAERDRAALRPFPEVGRAARDVAPIINRAARDHAESSVRQATGNHATVVSRDRPPNSPISSRAHDRGAIDVVTPKNMPNAAANISRQTGPGYTVIHEQPNRPASGPGTDTHTYYSGGNRVGSSPQPPRATGEHIHVQPEFNRRLHDATSPTPPTSKTSTSPRSGTAK